MKKCLISLCSLLMVLPAFGETINRFTQSMSAKPGFFDLYYDAKKAAVYLDVDKVDEEFILMHSLPYGLGSNDIGLDRGRQGGSQLVFFRRVGDKLFLVEKNTQYRANSDNAAERQSVREAFAESVLASFDVVASDKDSYLILINDYLLSDHMGIADRIQQVNQGSFQLNKSLSSIDESVIKSFPDNTELQSILTFSGKKAGNHLRQVSPSASSFTLRQRVSMVALPDDNYKPRVFHPYSGFWSFSYHDYAAGLTESMTQRFIPRHRLTKKNPAAEKSEAVEPIVYYVDRGAPEQVRNALLDGARWWNQAFEAAGYIDAFQVKVLPENVDPMDVRYNVIQWVHRATRGWSYGAGVTDPRTGEIIKGHVTLGSLRVRQDLLIARGVTAPFDNEPDLTRQQQMALARIRQLSAHEVGHTLGIAHNFAASADGRASVMDYPHPLFQIEDNKIVMSNAYDTGIGEWDKQVVKYGYGDAVQNNSDDVDINSDDQTAIEKDFLNSIIAESKQKELSYISDPDARPASGLHATAHLWDNGADAAKALTHIMSIRELALANFNQQVIADGVPFSQLEEVLVPVYNLHRFQVEAAVKLIAGRHYQYAVKGEDEFIQKTVDKQSQQAVLDALLKTLTPEFLALDQRIVNLIPPKAYGYSKSRESFNGKTGLSLDPLSIAEASANHTLSLLLNKERLTRLAQQSKDNQLTSSSVLRAISSQLVDTDYQQQDAFQINMRVLHAYITQLIKLYNLKSLPIESLSSVVTELDYLQHWTKKRLGRARKSDDSYGYYKSLQSLLNTREESFEGERPSVALPPGSPIGNN